MWMNQSENWLIRFAATKFYEFDVGLREACIIWVQSYSQSAKMDISSTYIIWFKWIWYLVMGIDPSPNKTWIFGRRWFGSKFRPTMRKSESALNWSRFGANSAQKSYNRFLAKSGAIQLSSMAPIWSYEHNFRIGSNYRVELDFTLMVVSLMSVRIGLD